MSCGRSRPPRSSRAPRARRRPPRAWRRHNLPEQSSHSPVDPPQPGRSRLKKPCVFSIVPSHWSSRLASPPAPAAGARRGRRTSSSEPGSAGPGGQSRALHGVREGDPGRLRGGHRHPDGGRHHHQRHRPYRPASQPDDSPGRHQLHAGRNPNRAAPSRAASATSCSGSARSSTARRRRPTRRRARRQPTRRTRSRAGTLLLPNVFFGAYEALASRLLAGEDG